MKRRGWTRLSAAGAKCDALWEHKSGWRVAHCGHQTAIWPYYALGPGSEKWAVADNGRGFNTLAIAFDAVEGVLAGVRQVVDYPDGPMRIEKPPKKES